MSGSKFRILSLDGGGIRGIITAKILAEVERKIGQPLNQYFDLIAGTSTGSIIAAGLVMGLSPEQLINLYKKDGSRIFPQQKFIQKITYWLNQPKYTHDGLIAVLRENLKEYTLSDLHTSISPTPKAKLLILAYNTVLRSTTFFLSPLVDADPWYKDVKVWEACTCSASAPTFFPPYQFKGKRLSPDHQEVNYNYTLVDGGVAVNNPALAALVHTLDIEKRPLSDISILSIGTGRSTQPLGAEEIQEWGALLWAKAITGVFMGAQIQVSSDLCRQLLDSSNLNQYLRLQVELNQRFDERGNLLPEHKQVNCYVIPPEKVSEEMDDVSAVPLLERVTDAFLKSSNGYRWSDTEKRYLTVKEAIERFIAQN